MSQAIVDLSRLIIKYGETEEIADAIKPLISSTNSLERDVLRCLLNNDPYDKLSEMIGSMRKLRSIASDLNFNDAESMGRDALLGVILSRILGNIYPSGLRVPGFYIVEKMLRQIETLHDEEKYTCVYRLVKQVEFLIKNIYRLLVTDLLFEFLDNPLREQVSKHKQKLRAGKFLSLNEVIQKIYEVEQAALINPQSILRQASKDLLNRETPFCKYDLSLMNRFVSLRNGSYAHQSKPILTEMDEIRDSGEMIDVLLLVCEYMQTISPKIIIQIFLEQDHLARNKIYYLREEVDFDQNGNLNSLSYISKYRRWDLRKCKYYYSIPIPRDSYKPGVSAYLIPGLDITDPYILTFRLPVQGGIRYDSHSVACFA
ncbi:hypothetical protein [Candidatus Chloroploca sp. Khr17]|uniref:hypothetical protein n=1 Tax=Candidatus Chloroploca sp. Khr17 TaxID=2496869 RepID=UPI00101D5D95|nr:hypothetical protein [Candidatus Chloroploca sp. Khr17]